MKKYLNYLVSLVALPLLAVTIYNPAPGLFIDKGDNSFAGIIRFLITGVFLPISGLIAIAFIIYGGFQYITSRGNDEQAESGKKTLTNAIIGLVIVILSYLIVVVVVNALKGSV